MANLKTSIEWCDATWNPFAGCSILSPGCSNCYAMTLAPRLEKMGIPAYAGLTKQVNGHAVWTGEIRLIASALEKPLHWQKPRRIFVNSMSDLFHESVPDLWIDRVFAVMALCPQHTFQVLTKRPDRMFSYCRMLGYHRDVDGPSRASKVLRRQGSWAYECDEHGWYLPNVWLGVSVEDQPRVAERINWLRETPAAVRFISAEPLLSELDLHCGGFTYLERIQQPDGKALEKIDWLIAGCESGPRRRSMQEFWVRSLLEQCREADTAVFLKQMEVHGRVTGDLEKFPLDLQIREFPA